MHKQAVLVDSRVAAPQIVQDMEKNKSIYAYVGQRIKERRRLLKMNQTQLAQLMGFSYQQMQKYENGVSEISVSKLLRFAKIFNVPASYFYEGAPMDDMIGKSIESDIIQKTRTEPLRVLLVENNPGDVILFKKAISACSEQVDIHIIHDSETVQDFLQNHAAKYGKPMPDVIILDLTLPKISGMELLKSIKRNSRMMETPVLVLTNSINKKEMHEAYRNGAAGFIQKSVDLEEYTNAIEIAVKYWARVVVLPHM
jgi:CheY-like chemotaxis protein/DNA-binding XRE family transcriptional regulator